MAVRKGSSIQEQNKSWLNKTRMHPAVRGQLGSSVPLSTFMKGTKRRPGLSKADRLKLVEQALVLLEETYVHLPLKRAIHAINPTRRLELLKFTLEETNKRDLPSEIQFHNEMQRIFTSTRDLHTNYLLPEPFDEKTAYLPFLIEEYFENDAKRKQKRGEVPKPKFLVSHVAKWFHHPPFKKGVEILFWNGVPIKRAIEINGENQAGSNLEARFACGLDALTIRPLIRSLPPDEEWVVITYSSPDGPRKITLDWKVFTPQPDDGAAAASGGQRATALGLDIKKAAINKVRKILFAPQTLEAKKGIAGAKATRPRSEAGSDWVTVEPSRLPGTFRAWAVKTRHGEFAYVRIFTFETASNRAGTVRFVKEFRRLIKAKALPQNGLIIDVRGNGGGNINAGEESLQLLTPLQIKPELFEMINTPLNRKISRLKDLRPWGNSLKEAVITGASYSHGIPLTSEKSCNEIGQIYYGPVVLIIDALCYSTTDMFTAGFQDHGIGTILGTNGNTGAGGANVWEHGFLRQLLSKSKSPFKPLPKGAGMRVAFRRSIRVGEQIGTAGRPLEELGVIPELRHYMTMNDLLNDNKDLINEAAKILAKKKVYNLSDEVYYQPDGTLRVTANTKNISRVDLYIDDCPIESRKVVDNEARFKKVPSKSGGPKSGRILVLKGFRRNKLVAALKKELSPVSRRRHR